MTRAFFCTNDVIHRAIWRHLSSLPYQFSILEDVGGWQPWMMMLLMMMVMMMMMMTIIVMMLAMLIWGCVSLLKSKIRSKIRIFRIFRWEKKRCIQKGIIVECLEGFSWREKKKEKKPKKKLPKCLVLSKSAPIQTLQTHFQPWLSNTELLIISHVWKGGICHWTFLFIWNWK